jgi:hypothetical protein
MPDAARSQNVDGYIRSVRRRGLIPVGILTYDVEKQTFNLCKMEGIDADELVALLKKSGIEFNLDRTK